MLKSPKILLMVVFYISIPYFLKRLLWIFLKKRRKKA